MSEKGFERTEHKPITHMDFALVGLLKQGLSLEVAVRQISEEINASSSYDEYYNENLKLLEQAEIKFKKGELKID